jgi:hypothetical protein
MSLEQQRAAFCRRRFLAMPLAGAICWSAIGIGSLFLSRFAATMLVFVGTGSIVYLAMLLSKLTGEQFFRKDKNPFDGLFFTGLAMALLVFAIAIPFFVVEPRSVTLSVGILTGLMWMPFSWIIRHWVGYFHALGRTSLIVIAWYAFPEHHFQTIPAIIVSLYAVTIAILEARWKKMTREDTPP